MKSVMLDIETWGTDPRALIIAIGACKFDPTGPLDQELDSFYVAIDPTTAKGSINAGTIMFWMDPKQAEARDRWFAEPKVNFYDALDGFAQWFGKKSLPTWGNGAGFDPIILESAFKTIPEDPPWDFRDVRCYRTFKAGVPDDLSKHINNKLNTDFGPGGHHALRDAQWQARFMIEANCHRRKGYDGPL